MPEQSEALQHLRLKTDYVRNSMTTVSCDPEPVSMPMPLLTSQPLMSLDSSTLSKLRLPFFSRCTHDEPLFFPLLNVRIESNCAKLYIQRQKMPVEPCKLDGTFNLRSQIRTTLWS
jgi:hypothetical protein